MHTEFLPATRYYQYTDWMKNQDAEARRLYFGVAGGDDMIDRLMLTIEADPDNHKFLVAVSHGHWAGTIHIAISGTQVEFGIMVGESYRGQGIGGMLLEQALIWARNRGYRELYMHCLSWNQPIKHLCAKHGLQLRNMLGETDVTIPLPPASWTTLIQETNTKNRNIFHTFLENSTFLYHEIYG